MNSVRNPSVNTTCSNSSWFRNNSHYNSSSNNKCKTNDINISSMRLFSPFKRNRTFIRYTTRTRGEHRWTAMHLMFVTFFYCASKNIPYWFSIFFRSCLSLIFCASLQTNQLTDIICRAVQPSIQSASNTLTRNASLRDTGDYAIPQPHPHHHIITSGKSTSSLIRCGSCPGSTGVSRRGSSSESSPAGTVGNASVIGGSDGTREYQGYYTDSTAHYDRMPMPIPIPIPAPPHLGSMHSEDEIEPAYATVFPNTTANIPQPQQQINYQTEDRSIYRRGARRWRKLYRINGHIFQAKRFNRVSKRPLNHRFMFSGKKEKNYGKMIQRTLSRRWSGEEKSYLTLTSAKDELSTFSPRYLWPFLSLNLVRRMLLLCSWYLKTRLNKWGIIEF